MPFQGDTLLMNRVLFSTVTLAITAIVCMATPALAQFGGGGPEVSYEAVTRTGKAEAGATLVVVLRVSLEHGWHVNAHEPLDPFLIATEVTLEESPLYTVEATAYPEHKLFHFAHSPDEPLAVYEGTFPIGLRLAIAPDAAPGVHTVNGTLGYQACDDKSCMPPKSLAVAFDIDVAAAGTPQTTKEDALFASLRWGDAGETEPEETAATPASTAGNWADLAEDFTVAGRLDGYANTDDFVAFIDRAESGNSDRGGLAGKRWWLVVLLVLGGGFMLNLTPCVLPLIPINIAIIGAGARAGSKVRGFALGGAYGLGIALVYGALGLVVVLGLASTFGAINSTAWFNGAIAVVFLVLGLAMFDIVHIDFSKYQTKVGVRKNEGGSFIVAFVMGSIAALLAGACVAPVVIYTIVYAQDAFAKGVTVALFLPFLLGVGMALPWPFAGAGLSFLPKPGMWMTRVKQAFGVFIVLFALYYAHLAYGIWSDRQADPEAVRESLATVEEEGWTTSLGEGLAQAQAEGKPVLIDFWATWCKNCLVMNKTTLKDAAVLDRLEGYVKIKVQAEDLDASGEARHYEVIGLPAYVVLTPKG